MFCIDYDTHTTQCTGRRICILFEKKIVLCLSWYELEANKYALFMYSEPKKKKHLS